MINLGASSEIIKNLIKKHYEPNYIVVDDLFVLSLDKCKQAQAKFCIICEELIYSDEAKKLAEFYVSKVQAYKVSEKVFERISSKENSAGILLYVQLEQIQQKCFSNFNKVLVCDGIEISGNIGTIVRTAEACNFDAIIFTNLKAKVYDEKIVHSSRGMIFVVPFIILPWEQTVTLLEQNNITPVVCEPEQGEDYKAFDYKGKYAYVVGSERFGCDNRWFNLNKVKYIKIPMLGQMHSLNVGVAASLIMYEATFGVK